MAYVDTFRGVIVLFPHKTGTHTLRTILRDHGRIPFVKQWGVASHPSLDQVKTEFPHIKDFYDYDVYAFYRDPVDRFMSWVAYNYRQYPLMEPYTNVHDYVDKYGFFAPQTRWIRHDKVTVKLLDFRNFETEVRRLLKVVGIPQNITIPKLNHSDNKVDPATLTESEVQLIKNMYADEYNYLASRGITFP